MRRSGLAAALLAVGLAGCSDDSGGPSENGGTPVGDIIVGNNFFDPESFTTGAGSEVVWAWSEGAAQHDIVFEDGGPGSGPQSTGTFSRTFTQPGEYPYFCSIHGAGVMSGVVTVGGTGGSGSGGDGGGGGGSGGSGGDGGGGGGGGGGGTPGGYPYVQGADR